LGCEKKGAGQGKLLNWGMDGKKFTLIPSLKARKKGGGPSERNQEEVKKKTIGRPDSSDYEGPTLRKGNPFSTGGRYTGGKGKGGRASFEQGPHT